jgi:hypothetical protein
MFQFSFAAGGPEPGSARSDLLSSSELASIYMPAAAAVSNQLMPLDSTTR